MFARDSSITAYHGYHDENSALPQRSVAATKPVPATSSAAMQSTKAGFAPAHAEPRASLAASAFKPVSNAPAAGRSSAALLSIKPPVVAASISPPISSAAATASDSCSDSATAAAASSVEDVFCAAVATATAERGVISLLSLYDAAVAVDPASILPSAAAPSAPGAAPLLSARAAGVPALAHSLSLSSAKRAAASAGSSAAATADFADATLQSQFATLRSHVLAAPHAARFEPAVAAAPAAAPASLPASEAAPRPGVHTRSSSGLISVSASPASASTTGAGADAVASNPLCAAARAVTLASALSELDQLHANAGRHSLDAAYFTRQPLVTDSMREILLDWLVDVHLKFKMNPLTFHIAAALLDRFLSTAPVAVSSDELQLVGCACLCVAGKYEEVRAPVLRDYRWVTDYSFTKKELQDMEARVLATLSFDLGSTPTVLAYCNQYLRIYECTTQNDLAQTLAAASGATVPNSNADNVNNSSSSASLERLRADRLRRSVEYVSECLIQTVSHLTFPPHLIAAAAVSLALDMNRHEHAQSWTLALSVLTGVSVAAAAPAVAFARAWLARMTHSRKLTATRDKYAAPAFLSVARLTPTTDATFAIATAKALQTALAVMGVTTVAAALAGSLRAGAVAAVAVTAGRAVAAGHGARCGGKEYRARLCLAPAAAYAVDAPAQMRSPIGRAATAAAAAAAAAAGRPRSPAPSAAGGSNRRFKPAAGYGAVASDDDDDCDGGNNSGKGSAKPRGWRQEAEEDADVLLHPPARAAQPHVSGAGVTVGSGLVCRPALTVVAWVTEDALLSLPRGLGGGALDAFAAAGPAATNGSGKAAAAAASAPGKSGKAGAAAGAIAGNGKKDGKRGEKSCVVM